MNLVHQLSLFSAFDHFGAEALELFASSLEPRRYGDAEVIAHADAPSNEAFLVLRGSVEVVDPAGSRTRVVGHKHVGQLFGVVGLLTGAKRTTQVRASGSVQVAVLSSYVFDLLYGHSGPASIPFCELVARQLVLDFRAVQATYFESHARLEDNGRSSNAAAKDVDEALDQALRKLSDLN